MLEKHTVAVSDIRVPLKRKKTLCEDKVQNIAESILENGQITPIQVRPDGEGYVLIEGLHRLEALRLLGEDSVLAYFVRARLH
ncbi:ParB N-terminal domain-containing protein [Salipiger bermudensis]|uniref:ParB N-terminal domain-containing protein n=1 Tax=Salipiger bermudensis TaxID=344736 RepID=UPI003008F57D